MCENCFGFSFLLNSSAIMCLIPSFISKSPGALVVPQLKFLMCAVHMSWERWNLPGCRCCIQFLLLTQGVSEGPGAAFLCSSAVNMGLCLSGICLGQPSLGVTQISTVKTLVSCLQLLKLWWPVRALIFCEENEKLLMQLSSGDAFKQQSSVWDCSVGYQLTLLLVCEVPFCKKHVEPKKCTKAS